MVQAPPRPNVGDLVAGRYELEELLASGSMGRVFAARHEAQPVALKILHPEWATDSTMSRRFRREATLLQSLTHPNIVRCSDAGNDPRGWLFIVMELLRGTTLRERLGSGAIHPQVLLPILEALEEGLGAAHEAGIWHGDLKPANIFIEDQTPENGTRLKIVDFGASKALGLDRLTRTGEACGTPRYMAPELLTGEKPLSSRIDVYSLGVITYEALAGSHPFPERHPGRLLLQIAGGQCERLDRASAQVSTKTAEVVHRAMSPDPAARHASPRELVTELRQVLDAALPTGASS